MQSAISISIYYSWVTWDVYTCRKCCQLQVEVLDTQGDVCVFQTNAVNFFVTLT